MTATEKLLRDAALAANVNIGMVFRHSRVLDAMKFDGKTGQVYKVTAIRIGMVYYRPVYDYGERTALGSPDCCPIADFGKYVSEVISK